MAPDTLSGIEPCWQTVGTQGDASCPELAAHLHCRNCPVHKAAATQLLNRAPPEGYLDEWTGHVARGGTFASRAPWADGVDATEAAANLSVLIFRLAGEWLALPTRLLEEVTEMRTVHSLPHRRSGVVLGIVNIHGGLLTCVSLGVLLGLAPAAEPQNQRATAEPQNQRPAAEPQNQRAAAEPQGQRMAAEPRSQRAQPEPQNQRMAAKRRMLVIGREPDRFAFPVDEVHGILRFRAGSLRPAPATVARAASSYTRQVLSWQDRSIGCLDAELLLDGLSRGIA